MPTNETNEATRIDGGASVPALPPPVKTVDLIAAEPERLDLANMLYGPGFQRLVDLADLFSQATIIPEQFRKQPANCLVAMQMALRLGVDPLAFLQESYVVNGRPGIEAVMAIALANQSGVFATRICYQLQGAGDTRSCTAWALNRRGERLSQTVTIGMAKAEGWYGKSGSKWRTLPDLMLQYRAAMFLIRLHAPEVLLGMEIRQDEPGDPVAEVKLPKVFEPAAAAAAEPAAEPEPTQTPPKPTRGYQGTHEELFGSEQPVAVRIRDRLIAAKTSQSVERIEESIDAAPLTDEQKLWLHKMASERLDWLGRRHEAETAAERQPGEE